MESENVKKTKEKEKNCLVIKEQVLKNKTTEAKNNTMKVNEREGRRDGDSQDSKRRNEANSSQ